MDLTCLLLTSDAVLLNTVRTAFSAVAVGLEVRADAASAIELAGRRHIDGFLIDCDDVRGGTSALASIRTSRSNKLSIVFAILNGKTSVSSAIEAGANFVVGKPVLDTLLRSHLDTALPRMEREHRRYYRHKVNVSIKISCSTETAVGKIVNVSEGGMALTHFGPAALEGIVTIEFDLPGTTAHVFRAKAELVWRDAFAIGLRFLRIENDSRLPFEAWLKSLDAQLQFRQSVELSNATLGPASRC
jgi:CheY-like chemotaxis protein